MDFGGFGNAINTDFAPCDSWIWCTRSEEEDEQGVSCDPLTVCWADELDHSPILPTERQWGLAIANAHGRAARSGLRGLGEFIPPTLVADMLQ
eukprot:6079731-Alexandrium_andersonii.AAC.1